MATTRLDPPSLKPDGRQKGTYFRRIADIPVALERLGARALPPVPRYLALYFGCEKLAKAVVGIEQRAHANNAYEAKMKLAAVKSAVAALSLPANVAQLEWLFAGKTEQTHLQGRTALLNASARVLRDKLVHDFGPTNVDRIAAHARFHLPMMEAFLGLHPRVLSHLEQHFQHVQ